MNKDFDYVSKYVNSIYPQLVINCQKTCGTGYDQWGDDLLSIAIESFLTKPLEVQLQTIEDNKCENLITRIMGLQLKSTSSPFYVKHRRSIIQSREILPDKGYELPPLPSINDKEALIQCLEEVLQSQDDETKEIVFERMYEDRSFKDIAEDRGLRYKAIMKRIGLVFEEVETKCQCYL